MRHNGPDLTPERVARAPLDRLAPVIWCAGLVLAAALPELTNITVLTLAALALFARHDWRLTFATTGVRLIATAVALIILCVLITARAPQDYLGVLVILPMIAVVPLARLFRRNAQTITAGRIGLAAGLGAVLALLVALWDAVILGLDRAGLSVNNPIHFADIALTLGLVAVSGLYTRSRRVTGFVLCAQFAALAAILLSGSRGALVAAVPCYMLAVVIILGHLGTSRRVILGLVLFGLAFGLGSLLAWQMGYFDRIIDMVSGLLAGTIDDSNRQRLSMYLGAWGAFQASPIWGHGVMGMVDAAIAFAPAGIVVPPYEHLHSDLADFATLGGILGLIAYALLILAPIHAALRAPPGPMRSIGFVIPLAYVLMGLTNAMLGLITQTVLYAVICALVLAASPPSGAKPAP